MSIPPIDLAAISKPLTKLVAAVAQGVGGIYRPVGTVLQAKADANARIILAQADIDVDELQHRALQRLLHVETERQKNLDVIIDLATSALPETVHQDPVEKDWITQFFGLAQDVSDPQMQMLWAKILAGEVAEPDSTSRRTLEFLKTISKTEAAMFVALLSVSFTDEHGWRFIVSDRVTYETIVTDFDDVDVGTHLLEIGILATEELGIEVSKLRDLQISYGGTRCQFLGPASPPVTPKLRMPLLENRLGIRRFTAIGQELATVAEMRIHPNFLASLSDSLKKIQVHIEF